MSALRQIFKLAPAGWRSQVLDILKREYRLGWPVALSRHPGSELDLLDAVLALHMRRPARARFLQVGACDGVMGDPIYPLIAKYGMTGVLIEPRSEMFERLTRNYAARFSAGDFVFINAAIAKFDGTMDLYSMKPGVEGPDWLAGTASFDKSILLQGLRGFKDPETLIRVESVKVVTFETLFRDYAIGKIDLLQADAEGFDAEILKMFDIGGRKPSIVRFEHIHLTPQDYESTIEMLVSHGYQIGLSATDTLAYRPEG